MKIVGVDNLASETVADRLLISFPSTPENQAKAQEFCDWLNTFTCDDYGGRFYKIVPADYRLSRGMEDLV